MVLRIWLIDLACNHLGLVCKNHDLIRTPLHALARLSKRSTLEAVTGSADSSSFCLVLCNTENENFNEAILQWYNVIEKKSLIIVCPNVTFRLHFTFVCLAERKEEERQRDLVGGGSSLARGLRGNAFLLKVSMLRGLSPFHFLF